MYRPLSKQLQRGATLIEVMISVLVMAIGLLGIAAMQTTALRNSQSSLERSGAVIQAYTVLDAMRANRDIALAGGYNTSGYLCAAPTGASLAETDKAAWLRAWKGSLGVAMDDASACGSIDCQSGICDIGLKWDDSRAVNAAGSKKEAGNSAQEFMTTVQL
ncbi:type IV pilus modification protein PilV [Xanthomonas sp. 4461]|uniref:Type IV pilus modification protein PilV n=1 Tax=Xanthomonas sp. 10-10 TaxID=3115848 RepID=A0AAU7P413_9XANT|nr:type IV pilus modification protein PilV [Xanthomonas sp. 4461]MCS3807277.1 type IV pilus assembly protein PilV [Xanthomonas sp. 4461]